MRTAGVKISKREPATHNIFISYRREDSAAYAGRLCDHLNLLVGSGRVFMDVEDIAPGQPFARTIDETIAHCSIALIVIGPRWAEILNQRAREQQPDYVSHEVGVALARGITIVPVLVGGAAVAELAGLPGGLSALSQYEAAELRDSSFGDDCARLAGSLGLKPGAAAEVAAPETRTRPAMMYVAGAVLLIGLLLAAGWFLTGPWAEHRARKAAIGRMFATAKSQVERAEYELAFKTYQDLLKTDPENRVAMEGQVDAAMGWVEDFHVIVPEGGDASKPAGTSLAAIVPVLDAGLARAGRQQPRAADILAHIGWAHWLNQKIAQREFGPAAERDLRRALKMDPSNVFAHAMLANWMMQTGGSTGEALEHFRIAVETKRARALVRGLELGVMVYPADPQTRSALIRVADEMRRNGEPIDDGSRSRILTAYDPTVNSPEELSQTLSAVPPDRAWATYIWLEGRSADGGAPDSRDVQHDFIHASLLEIERKRQDALEAFESLRSELNRRGYDGRIVTHVNNAIARLSAR